jgi:hypothetical protein
MASIPEWRRRTMSTQPAAPFGDVDASQLAPPHHALRRKPLAPSLFGRQCSGSIPSPAHDRRTAYSTGAARRIGVLFATAPVPSAIDSLAPPDRPRPWCKTRDWPLQRNHTPDSKQWLPRRQRRHSRMPERRHRPFRLGRRYSELRRTPCSPGTRGRRYCCSCNPGLQDLPRERMPRPRCRRRRSGWA